MRRERPRLAPHAQAHCLGPWALAALLLPATLAAHPLGNNTVSRAAEIEVERQGVHLSYRLDLAEIPTLLAAAAADRDRDGRTTDREWGAWVRDLGAEVTREVRLWADGRELRPRLEQLEWHPVPGAAGLSTLRIWLGLSAPWVAGPGQSIQYQDLRRPEEPGWKEVSARAGPGLRLIASEVPESSPTQGLSIYPPSGSPPSQVLGASLRIESLPGPIMDPAPVAGLPAEGPEPGAAADSGAPAGHPPLAWPFFRLGVQHIAVGLDHLVFLLGLVAGERRPGRIAWIISAFTLAHSLALGLAAAHLVRPPADWVEPAVGLTILYVGIANLAGGARHGAWVALGFGLIHGFAFAGALAEHLARASATPEWLLDLAAFNLGVEAGQLAFVLLLVLLARACRQLEVRWTPWMGRLPGILVASLGAYWTIQRTAVLLEII